MNYRVLFDGTSKAPMGRLLFAPETQPVDPQPVSRHYGMTTARVRALRTDERFQDWFTIADVKAATGFDGQQTNSALTNLGKSGDVVREREFGKHARPADIVQRYRFIK